MSTFSNIMGRGHRHDKSVTSTLPAISEDGDTFAFPAPPMPQRGRPTTPRTPNGMSSPGRNAPTSYMSDSDSNAAEKVVEPLPHRRFSYVNNKMSRRGGWKRFALLGLVASLCIVGLVVGLVVGLRNRKSNSNSNNTSTSPESGASPTTPALNTTFPAGFYRFDTSLASSATSCTSNSATWNCYQGSPYTSLDWTIQPVSSGSSSYEITSTNNPFAFVFANQSLTLVDIGTATERYTFQISANKVVKPGVPLTSSNLATTCTYSDAKMQASLYTRMPGTVGSNSVNPPAWPYAIMIQQVSGSAPSCVDSSGNSVGIFAPATAGQGCNCVYQNYNV